MANIAVATAGTSANGKRLFDSCLRKMIAHTIAGTRSRRRRTIVVEMSSPLLSEEATSPTFVPVDDSKTLPPHKAKNTMAVLVLRSSKPSMRAAMLPSTMYSIIRFYYRRQKHKHQSRKGLQPLFPSCSLPRS